MSWHVALRLGLALLALVGAAMLHTDVSDLAHDTTAHLWRPLPSGLVTPSSALRVAAALLIVAVALAASLGWRDLLILIGLAAAAALYSLDLRGSLFGWFSFALVAVLLPLLAAEALNDLRDVLWWSLPVGGSAGLAAYLVYKLPDYERDDEDGQRNVLHWMTIDYAVPVTWGAIAIAATVAAASANSEDFRAEWFAPPAGLLIVVALTMTGFLIWRVTEQRLLWQRWLVLPCLMALELGWMGSIAP